MKKVEIEKIVLARLVDAEVLYDASRYDGSVYLCGYAVELGLKSRICKTLQWDEYPTNKTYQTFKTHDLDILLHLSGCEEKIKNKYFAIWSIVAQWNPEARYSPIGNVKQVDAKEMLQASKDILKQL
jgi:HEPN domain-containing protein